jgi:hypothetical protein
MGIIDEDVNYILTKDASDIEDIEFCIKVFMKKLMI